MKILKIKRCDEPDCQFFKRIERNGDKESDLLGICQHEKRYVTESDQLIRKGETWFESEVIFVPGTFPDWCPLEDI
jgi:hypothetical protein